MTGCNRQPALNLGGTDWVGGQPAAVTVFFCQVHQNGIRIRQDYTLIVQHWNLAKGIEGQKVRLLMCTIDQIDKDKLSR
ncbi:hypothetical protein D3C80_2101370 [compost metagenome]